MIAKGELVDDVLRALRRSNSEEDRRSVNKYVNKFYFSICRSIPIIALRRSVDIDLSDSDYSDGMWLKSNMADILSVKDVDGTEENDEFFYIHRDRATFNADEVSYRYYDYVPSDGALASGSDAYVVKKRNTFTATSLSDDHTGEYIRFGSEPGMYLLTAEKTFSPYYYGESLDEADWVIRPEETRKIVCLDQANEAITDRSITVFYWIMPNALYKTTDVPLLNDTRALELMVMKEAMTIIGKRQLTATSFDKDIEKAMDTLRKLNPPPKTALKARDNKNAAFTMENNIFTDR